MTKLESDIENVMLNLIKEGNENTTYWAHIIAEKVCKGYIERAFDAGYARFRAEEYGAVPTKAPSKSDWLKSEGITE